MNVDRLAIVGTGLIGASVGLGRAPRRRRAPSRLGPEPRSTSRSPRSAARSRPPRRSTTRRDRRRARRRRGAGRRAAQTSCAGVLEPRRRARTVTDVGSTKRPVCAAAGADPRFVGGHPICGAETRGPGRATAELFDGATWFLTPDGGHRSPSGSGSCTGSSASLGARPGRDRARRARPARRGHEPPPARPRERAPQPGRLEPDRRPRPAAGRGRLAARHDADRRRQPADLGRHLPRQPRGARGRARRAAARASSRSSARSPRGTRASSPAGSARRAGTGGGCSRRRSPTRGRCTGCAIHIPDRPGRARRDLPGARRRADQRRGLRARPRLRRARRDADDARLGRGRGASARPSCSSSRATASSPRR